MLLPSPLLLLHHHHLLLLHATTTGGHALSFTFNIVHRHASNGPLGKGLFVCREPTFDVVVVILDDTRVRRQGEVVGGGTRIQASQLLIRRMRQITTHTHHVDQGFAASSQFYGIEK